MSTHFVYLYRTRSGVPQYVGYGHSVQRALSHAEHSHNPELRAWLERDDFELTIAGPYRDQQEGKSVEAALISALRPKLNRAPGDGPKFVPVGVPPELGDRGTMPALSGSALGQACGGALIVYLAPGDFLDDGRRKYDAAQPVDADVLANMRGVWDIGKHVEPWAADPAGGPQVLVGVHGQPAHRFIVGAAMIDNARWLDPSLRVPTRNRYFVPLLDPVSLDAGELRGRRVTDVKFGNYSWQLHQWFDASGHKRHPVA